MRQAAIGAQLRAESMQPAIGIMGICRAGGLPIRLCHGGTRNQGKHKRDHLRSRIVQIAHRGIEIKLCGAATASVMMPIGTKHPLTGRCRIGTGLLFIDEAVRNQLMSLLAMRTLLMVQLPGLLLNGVEAGVVDLHDGTGMEKVSIMQRSIPAGKSAQANWRYNSLVGRR